MTHKYEVERQQRPVLLIRIGRMIPVFFQAPELVVSVVVSIILAAQAQAASVSTAAIIDLGGQRSGSVHYQQDDSIGGIIGVTTVAVPTEVARHGYIGQLTEVTNLTIRAAAPFVPSLGTVPLGGLALLDDGTATMVGGGSLTWDAPVAPVSSISVNGVATATAVALNTAAFVSGSYLGVNGSGNFMVVVNTARGSVYTFR